MRRRDFLRSALAAAATTPLASSTPIKAIAALAEDLAAEAAALLQAQHNAILDSAFGESTMHLRMLHFDYDQAAKMASLIQRTNNLLKRVQKLGEDGTDVSELEDALNSRKDAAPEGLELDDIEQLVAEAEAAAAQDDHVELLEYDNDNAPAPAITVARAEATPSPM